MLRGLRGDAHASGIVRTLLSFEDSGDFPELAAYFDDHLLGGAAHCIHRQSAEQEGHHRADEYAGEDYRIHDRDIIVRHDLRYGRMQLAETDLDFFDI